ncbi:MAG: T9SS type A sorting domain-containing protein, partial [Bacteroidota bacterium]|nr:T9SS type A sorting domain-containing protein [Bacteroidota bacterium]
TMVDNYNVLTDSTDFDGDGVHPSVAGYKKMRYVWYPAVVSAMLTTSVRMKAQSNPQTFELDQNYPNPFNPSTNIRYSIPSESYVTLNVYDLLGRLVTSLVEGKQSVGTHSVTFNVAALPTGVYIYAMRAGNFTAARKMVLIK